MMNKKNGFISIMLLFVFASCGSAKNKVTLVNKSKLETQFKLYEGVPYKYGGTDKRGFDCSGYVNKVFKDAFKVQLPRTTKEIAKQGKKYQNRN